MAFKALQDINLKWVTKSWGACARSTTSLRASVTRLFCATSSHFAGHDDVEVDVYPLHENS